MGRNSDGEQYLPGTSDYPRSPSQRLYFGKRPRLEDLSDSFSIRILNPNGTVNIEATNTQRLELARKKHLGPVVIEKGVTYYRHVTKDKDGLINVKYELFLPTNMGALFSDETMTYHAAAQYLGISKDEVSRIVGTSVIKGSHGRVLLADVNKYRG